MAKRRIPKVKQIVQYVTFVLDYSGSMMGLSRKLIESYKNELNTLREQSASTKILTFVSVVVFGNDIQYMYSAVPVNDVRLDTLRYSNMGGTALFDAIGTALSTFNTVMNPVVNDTAHLVTVITDGEENQSKNYRNTIGHVIAQYNTRGDTTVVIQCPPYIKQQLVDCGIPQDNITTWVGTEQSLNDTSLQKTAGLNSYYQARTKGTRSVSNFYSPDLNFSPTKLKRELVDVTHQFLIAGITKTWNGKQIRDFVESELNKSYTKGCSYYQLTKPETVQAAKQIVVRDLGTGRMYGGEDARELLKIPEHQEFKIVPSNWNNQYEVFIQSTSVNRKLVAGTKILVRS